MPGGRGVPPALRAAGPRADARPHARRSGDGRVPSRPCSGASSARPPARRRPASSLRRRPNPRLPVPRGSSGSRGRTVRSRSTRSWTRRPGRKRNGGSSPSRRSRATTFPRARRPGRRSPSTATSCTWRLPPRIRNPARSARTSPTATRASATTSSESCSTRSTTNGRGFEFFVNPLGVQMDLSINDVGGGEDETWDALWNAAGRITASGYVVEMEHSFHVPALPPRERGEDLGHGPRPRLPAEPAVHPPHAAAGPQPQLLPLSGLQARRSRGDHARPEHRARPDADGPAQRRPRRPGLRRPRGRGRRRRAGLDRAMGHDAQSDLERGDQPRLLAGRGGRRAARGEHPVRSLLSGEAAALPRGRRLLPDAPVGHLHANGGGPGVGPEAHRKGGEERARLLRLPRRDHEPHHSRERELVADLARREEHGRSPPLSLRHRKVVDGRGPLRRA